MIQEQASQAHPGRFTLTLDHVWLAVALMLIALRPLLTPIPPNDFWWHMATGRAIIAQGAIPVIDSFSYTQAGQPFFNQGWLAQLLMYGIYQLGGIPLTYIFQALVIALAYGLLLRLCLLRTGQVQLSVGLLLMTLLLSFDNWLVRPQSYALSTFRRLPDHPDRISPGRQEPAVAAAAADGAVGQYPRLVRARRRADRRDTGGRVAQAPESCAGVRRLAGPTSRSACPRMC